MNEASRYLELADWRRRVGELYADVRVAPEAGREIAWNEWRAARNDLFRGHGQSPLSEDQRARFQALAYFRYDPAWRVTADLDREAKGRLFHYQLGEDGELTIQRIGWVTFTAGALDGRLALYWIVTYGGGLFLPFKDVTSGDSTYGGGRYLLDTIKGADLGRETGRVILDFNYAYNPSCAYHPRWVCPLAPAENTLPFPVAAGEKRYAPKARSG